MTDRDKSILEEPEKMCEYCCNFDKEHIGMDGTALCKLTMTLAYSEDYGGNCIFYNVPKERIIVPPCKVGQIVYVIEPCSCHHNYRTFDECHRRRTNATKWIDVVMVCNRHHNRCMKLFERPYKNEYIFKIGKTVFLTKEEAEEKLKELKDNA